MTHRTGEYGAKYGQLFDYLSAPELPTEAAGALVFGRKDPLVAQAYVDLVDSHDTPWGIITGGVGKDSGDLTIPESEYLAQEAMRIAKLRNVDLPVTHLETEASNGGENVRNSLVIMREAKLGIGAITAVAHATSLRRLAAMAEHESAGQGTPFAAVYRKPSAHSFDAANPTDQAEAIGEMKRLIDWPAKGWLRAGSNLELPEDLVDFAEDVADKR